MAAGDPCWACPFKIDATKRHRFQKPGALAARALADQRVSCKTWVGVCNGAGRFVTNVYLTTRGRSASYEDCFATLPEYLRRNRSYKTGYPEPPDD